MCGVALRRVSLCAFAVLWSLAVLAVPSARAQEGSENEPPDIDKLFKWIAGPADVSIGGVAGIKIPAGYRALTRDDTQKIMELMENPVSGDEMALVATTDFDWFFVFEFDACGYVKDDEKADLDPRAMLESIREGNEQGNEMRKERGWAPLKIIGWETPPAYDEQTQNLAWAIRAESEGAAIVNYNTRRLGRRGVMEISLVADPEQLPKALPEFKKLMQKFEFRGGNRYGDFVAGDKVAEYGLAALVTGGVAAVALKSGILGKFWKLIVFAVVAVLLFVKKIFGAIGGLFGGASRRQPAK